MITSGSRKRRKRSKRSWNLANRRPLRGAFIIPPPQGAVADCSSTSYGCAPTTSCPPATKVGYARDAVSSRLLPIGINRIPKTSVREHSRAASAGSPTDCASATNSSMSPMFSVLYKIRAVQDVVDGVEPRLGIRPFAQFLGEPTVVGMRTLTVRKPLRTHQVCEVAVHGLQIQPPPTDLPAISPPGGCPGEAGRTPTAR